MIVGDKLYHHTFFDFKINTVMKHWSLFFVSIAIGPIAFGQLSGNHVYKDRYQQARTELGYTAKAVTVKDSLLFVSASVLLNAKADSLLITFGASEEAKTVKEANTAVNKRLASFKAALKELGISESDAYTDFITQTKIYDYTVAGTNATQYIKGFEIKKNLIVRIVASTPFDKLVELASESEIYDVVKVDYVSSTVQKIYAGMMAAAANVIKQKKETYLQLAPVELLPLPKISYEKFFAVYPATQYKQYEAFESSDVTADHTNARLIKKIERKAKTFYYDKIDQAQFDLVVNNASPVVGIQYVLEVQLQYDLKKQ